MSRKKVLLVDDEEEFLEIMRQRVESWGYDVAVAKSGREALTSVLQGGFDIVIMDYMMPVMDGVSTLKQIRKAGKDIPVIIFTAYPDERSVEGTEKLGVSAFIPKLTGYSESALKVVLDKTFSGQ